MCLANHCARCSNALPPWNLITILFLDRFYASWHKTSTEKWNMSFSLGLISKDEDNFRSFQALLLTDRNKPSVILLSKYPRLGDIFQTIVSVCAGGSQVIPLGLSYMNHLEILFPGTFTLNFFFSLFGFIHRMQTSEDTEGRAVYNTDS